MQISHKIVYSKLYTVFLIDVAFYTEATKLISTTTKKKRKKMKTKHLAVRRCTGAFVFHNHVICDVRMAETSKTHTRL